MCLLWNTKYIFSQLHQLSKTSRGYIFIWTERERERKTEGMGWSKEGNYEKQMRKSDGGGKKLHRMTVAEGGNMG